MWTHTGSLRPWAFDTETGLIAPGLLAPTLVCVSQADDHSPDGRLGLPSEMYGAVVEALQDPGVVLVGQNIAYDFGVLANEYPELLPLIFQAYADGRVSDTKIREKLLDLAAGKLNDGSSGANARRRYDMATLWERYFNEDISEDKKNPDAWRLRYIELLGLPVEKWPPEAARYAREDAVRTLRLWWVQVDKAHEVNNRNGNHLRKVIMRENGRLVNEEETCAAAWVLHLMGMWGVRTDGEAVGKLAAKLQAELRLSNEALLHAGVLKYKKDGTEQRDMARIKALVTAAYNGAPPTTDKGAPSTDKQTLLDAPTDRQPRQLLTLPDGTQESRPVLQILAGISAIKHNLDTYVDALAQGATVPITPRWNELVGTGRTSCQGPNLQNLPRTGGWRRCLQPRPGMVYINADYSTIELRTLAQTCFEWFGSSALLDAMNGGVDPHLLLASDILGISYEEALTRKKEKEVKDARQMSKAANFGYPGGLGAGSFVEYARASYGVVISEQEGRRLKDLWLQRWPEMRRYFQQVQRFLNQGHRSLEGDQTYQLVQPVSLRVRGGTGYCDGCNSYFQGRAADGAKYALFLASQEAYLGYSELWDKEHTGVSPLYGYRPIILAHDEIVLEGPEHPEWATPADPLPPTTRAARRLEQVMVQAMQRYVPDCVILAEPAIMRRYDKDAESTCGPDGALSIWEPK